MSASLLRLRHFLLLLLLPAAIACTKKGTDQPAPTTGSIEGTVSPADGLKSVTATNAGGLTFLATPTAAGAFAIDKLVPGTYTLFFDPNLGYQAPASRSITVAAGAAAAAGVVVVVSDGSIRSGTASWTVSGQNFSTAQVTGGISRSTQIGDIFSLTASTRNSTGVIDEVKLFVGGIDLVPRTYILESSPNSASYTRIGSNGQAVVYQIYSGQQGSSGYGTLTVSSYNAATGTLTGTFAFSAPPTSGSGGSLAVTNGTFSVRI